MPLKNVEPRRWLSYNSLTFIYISEVSLPEIRVSS